MVSSKREKSEHNASEERKPIAKLSGETAHSMNNVLAAIMAVASAAKFGRPSDDPVCVDLDEIIAACKKGRAMTIRLLEESKKAGWRPV